MKDRVTLEEHIRTLILEGKRGNHPDYKPFFELFGKDKIVALAKQIKAEEKEKDEGESEKEV